MLQHRGSAKVKLPHVLEVSFNEGKVFFHTYVKLWLSVLLQGISELKVQRQIFQVNFAADHICLM